MLPRVEKDAILDDFAETLREKLGRGKVLVNQIFDFQRILVRVDWLLGSGKRERYNMVLDKRHFESFPGKIDEIAEHCAKSLMRFRESNRRGYEGVKNG